MPDPGTCHRGPETAGRGGSLPAAGAAADSDFLAAFPQPPGETRAHAEVEQRLHRQAVRFAEALHEADQLVVDAAGHDLGEHAARWLEGGLTGSMEKFILDGEALQIFAEIFRPLASDDAELAYDAIAAVEPGSHFFACEHTMQRYQTAFYEPLVSDWSNFGQWSESGSLTATQRAGCLVRLSAEKAA